MSVEALSVFIAEYIAGRRQTKLEAFDKEAAKRSDTDSATLAAERRELELRYEPKAWLTDAAKRAGQINLVTHAAKFTHGDSKSSSIYSEAVALEGYLSTAALSGLEPDAVGNAAALDVAKLLQTRVEGGDSLLASLKRGDRAALAAFTDDANQLDEWIAGFSRALTPGEPASHKLAKQGYFPVGENYHLLSPLFATSLVHAMHQKMIAFRFGDDVKAIWKARREKTWHPTPLTLFPHSAEIHFGGTKPQNISYLNSVRGGRSWLLSCQPPQWKKADKPPTTLRSIFTSGGQFDRRANSTVQLLVSLLARTGDYTNVRIREARDEYIDALIDLLFVVASELQRDTWQNWTLSCERLVTHQQLWLDPWRTKTDEAFRLERDKDDWQVSVATDFALWLNARLSKVLKDLGYVEQREWQTRERLRSNLREMEKIIREALK
ncbi:type I-F CRISPR-associated protein Csy1 [Enterobacter cloacae complex sp. P3B]|uniref:type I-F CRISPR-associated protein Csy1 n=1 Tax=unclassified Enterobacter cloacae complex TaxID=2757714 RepID=UPI001866B9F3|nr:MULTISPECIES: type I-F CRISPR-associated protein Csy1 [unclassified Enterobacter cloacae complex]MBE3176689.1 type I-F CRISPR-associated protein Csy1 [Enterobacter cloacae complex sp. P26RS]MBE3435398.1 type I-F CRISPR-associated protein Csy1 [Enterobacter cloacae complex sp. P21RS]MBE3459401.1 type I-F CRISPR-associated protein Csy1 [Enterobacter cloacae complex sp. P21C]MBE3501251.1 type I-F CRISPR-associated protein Csy1 [Enterobacter cloacae complex sp. P2B]MBE3502561.1 type I-F CRISPR-